MEHKKTSLNTKDKVNLSFEHNRSGYRSLIVICPGFFNSKKNRWMRKTVELVSDCYDTFIFDFRGHGESSGKFTWSAKEYLDVEAVLDYVAGYKYNSIGILAYSLGAAASITAANKRKDVKAMVLVSCPFSFWQINYHFWQPEMLSDLKDNIDCDWEGKGARVGSLFRLKKKPINEIKKIKDIPILFIHGQRDWVIKDSHSQKLYAVVQGPKGIELIEDGLHAERMVQQNPERMKKLILNWFNQALDKEV